jgi:alpha-D-ribose 1-methylphosphonate 5-triphosphate synthase subunit PhnL
MTALIETLALSKTFTLHGRGGMQLPVFADIDLSVQAGECLALTGHSGSGKSSLLRCLYGNYGASSGEVRIRHFGDWVSLSTAAPREVFEVRRRSGSATMSSVETRGITRRNCET